MKPAVAAAVPHDLAYDPVDSGRLGGRVHEVAQAAWRAFVAIAARADAN